ncbi:hypothetical protein QCK_1707 [Clostridioides difficile CD45]|uniref:Panacea domain-containing protein n=1 Tax=Clostridioides difficile TaxID=1496 RepID=UPI00038D1B81|nr:type II toxin-antitoxin system antitoxin SocA domain-containing protein [Clostridioides difficile]EGT4019840.1 DUF4065 domain-containing protein [Clostridioides difficile]EJA6849120.1 DUF4065 domain-containing protein [Clostridioides difficile]EQE65864.1 hypothetical protein QCK_1707 [Clostridioides difficile CD45]MBH7525101.1 DUF4065 domain-containing protein [Clostridioides difficile]MBY1846374.1 DUF4065 domain-containing protein [Clostridioides difficile]
MSYKVMEIAQHVINYSIEQNAPVTNLKLQKLLYYIQAAFLVEFKEKCFDEEIVHWRHGPVVYKVYSEYKIYTDEEIKDRQLESSDIIMNTNFNFSVEKIEYDKINFLQDDLELIDKVIDSYKNYTPWDMVKKTHEEKPWKNTIKNETIKTQSIAEYFLNNPDEIYGGQ